MRRKIISVFIFIISFLAGFTISYFLLGFTKVFVKTEKPVPETSENKVISRKDSYNFLLLGYGGAGHDGGYLTDVIIILNINTLNKKATLISIPRDLWVPIPTRSDMNQYFKINAAYAIGLDDAGYPLKEPVYKGEAGGANLAKKVISQVSGLNIDYFASVSFDEFKKIIDTLGGIEVDVPVAFDDYFYPVKGLENETCGKTASEIEALKQKFSGFDLEKQFECRYEHLHFDKGITKMDGETALKFVRSRHSNESGGDFARSQRQQEVLTAVKDKIISANSIKNVEKVFNQFINMLKTDMDLNAAKQLAELLGDPKAYKISFVGLNEDNVLMATKSLDGQFILIPKEGEGVWNKVQEYIYDSLGSL